MTTNGDGDVPGADRVRQPETRLAGAPVGGANAVPAGARFVSLSTKLALSTMLVLSAFAAVVYVALASRERETLVSSKEKAASMVADVFAAQLVAPLDFTDQEVIARDLDHLATHRDLTSASVWSVDPPALLARRGDDTEPPPPADAVAASFLRADDLSVVRPVRREDGTRLGTARLRYSLAAENAEYRAHRAQILLATGGLALLVAAVLLALGRALVVAPLGRLADVVHRIELGQAGARVGRTDGDEIGRLGLAFNRMIDAVGDREARLAQLGARLRGLLDHMREAIVVIAPGGRVEEAPSREAARVFGPDLPGRDVRDLLYPGVPAWSVVRAAFDAWIDLAFAAPPDVWDELAAHAPDRVCVQDAGGERWLGLEFRPIVKDGATSRLMLLATDVTERHRLEQAVQTQEERHARELASMRRLVAGGGQAFVSFLDAAAERLTASVRLVTARPVARARMIEVFHHVHTVRGEARAYELTDLVTACGRAEECLTLLRAESIDDAAPRGSVPAHDEVVAALAGHLEAAVRAVDHGRELLVEASPIGRAVLDQMTVRRSDVAKIRVLTGPRDDALGRAVTGLSSRPFGECVAALEAVTPGWAERSGKHVRLAIEGRDARVPPDLARLLGGVLTHLTRNAVAHGIEPVAVREARGKSSVGTIRAEAAESDAGLTVTLADDGAGIDAAALDARARAMHVQVGDDVTASELMFVEGLSTSHGAAGGAGDHGDDALSGLGIGLAAVRADLRALGCTMTVWSEPGLGTRFEIRAPWTSPDVVTRAEAGSAG
jgi:two-component system chemotaxis sensor kinase CheA